MAGRRSLALIALLGCILAGCSDAASDDPTTTPTESPTSSERDVIASVPTLPPAARKDTLKGAEAFIRHYIELRNYASNTGDTKEFRAASDSCSGCDKYAQLYEKTYAKGGFIRSAGWRTVAAQAFDQRTSVAVLVTAAAPRMSFKRTAEDTKEIGRGGRYKLRFELKQHHGRWVVTEFGVQPKLPQDR